MPLRIVRRSLLSIKPQTESSLYTGVLSTNLGGGVVADRPLRPINGLAIENVVFQAAR
jgi:NRPS condensation-like uncharacterized protein